MPVLNDLTVVWQHSTHLIEQLYIMSNLGLDEDVLDGIGVGPKGEESPYDLAHCEHLPWARGRSENALFNDKILLLNYSDRNT